ncbi:hypothetical protein GCM10009789_24940 [Kribbella sancticallisti]|uniref:Activator of Hsp90 ATPase homologue 1/2-like C-terminal domain-containing protein n=1 Tax=Kribbella sancticallisti TaxID=460087 RepID=A0ABN2D5E7_9ACTN
MSEQLTSKDGRTVLRMERALAHPPEKVWRALTEPTELAGWFPAAVELDLRLDGRIEFTFEEGEDDFVEDPDNTGVIRAYDPPRLLEYNWGAEIQRWELTPTDAGCLLTLTATYDDRPGSASFTAGWTMCFDALDRVLGGGQVPARDYAELHEHFVHVYGLEEGVLLDDGSIRFERQLTAPKEDVWTRLTGAIPLEPLPADGKAAAPRPDESNAAAPRPDEGNAAAPRPGDRAAAPTPPPGFVAKGIEAGAVRSVEPPVELSYEWQHGLVTWRLRDGNGGARLVLTQTGPSEQYLAPWQDLIETLAADLAAQPHKD